MTAFQVPLLVEGSTDEAVMRRLLAHVGLEAGLEYGGGRGKGGVLKMLPALNNMAHSRPVVAVADLDTSFDCAPRARAVWLPHPNEWMCFRIPVREIESWLLADTEGFSEYFKVASTKLPKAVDELGDPKRKIVDLVRSHSKSGRLRKDVVPRDGSGIATGPGYAGRIREFVSETGKWRPEVAAGNSDSLTRAITALTRLKERYESYLNGNSRTDGLG